MRTSTEPSGRVPFFNGSQGRDGKPLPEELLGHRLLTDPDLTPGGLLSEHCFDFITVLNG